MLHPKGYCEISYCLKNSSSGEDFFLDTCTYSLHEVVLIAGFWLESPLLLNWIVNPLCHILPHPTHPQFHLMHSNKNNKVCEALTSGGGASISPPDALWAAICSWVLISGLARSWSTSSPFTAFSPRFDFLSFLSFLEPFDGVVAEGSYKADKWFKWALMSIIVSPTCKDNAIIESGWLVVTQPRILSWICRYAECHRIVEKKEWCYFHQNKKKHGVSLWTAVLAMSKLCNC